MIKLIIDTNKYSGNFERELGAALEKIGKMEPTPNYGNNGIGFNGELTEENYAKGKELYISYLKESKLAPIEASLKFYEGSRANIDYWANERTTVLADIADVEARDPSTFLSHPAYNSVSVRLYETSTESEIESLKEKAHAYCEAHDIKISGFRVVDDSNVRTEEVVKPNTSGRKDLKVTVMAHDGYLIIDTLNHTEKDADFLPVGSGRIGCALYNSKRVGISDEAVAIIKSMGRTRDVLGDLCGDENSFTWIGGLKAIFGPDPVGNRDFKLCKDYVTIPNDVPEDAIEAIIEMKKPKEIEFKDIEFNLWLDFTKTGDTYRADFRPHSKHFWDEKLTILNAPQEYGRDRDGGIEVHMEDKDMFELSDLFFHNILGEKLIDRVEKKPEDMGEFERKLYEMQKKWDWNIRSSHGYRSAVDSAVIWDYVNSFFDLGFSNNIMHPREDYFRLSIDGTVEQLKEKLCSFKLVTSETVK